MARLFLVLRRSDRSRQEPLANFAGEGLHRFRAASQGQSQIPLVFQLLDR
jgi:hypothetical protein